MMKRLPLAIAGVLLLCTEAIAETCTASVYTVASNRGTRTASGIPFRNESLTAAHKKLPFGTRVQVTHRKNGRSVIVTITDRGPFIRGRCIDLSPVSARAIGLGYSIAPVTVAVLKQGK